MSILEKIFASKSMQDMAFGTLKKYMRENSIQYLLVELQPDEEIGFKAYATNDKPVIMPEANMQKAQQIMQDQERAITGLSERLEVLAQENEALVQSLNGVLNSEETVTNEQREKAADNAWKEHLKTSTYASSSNSNANQPAGTE